MVACIGSDQTTGQAIDRLGRITSNLVPAVQVTGAPSPRHDIIERMKHYNTPGVSVAVADSGRIVWTRGFGVTMTGTADSITANTMFEAGSISKAVAATATLRLVEQGALSLDEPVNTYLKSWKLPDNRFTAKAKVTLRRILSHSAGLTVHGFPGYAVTDSVPTVPQVLDGRPPANTPPVRVDAVPGSFFRYSGGGTTIEQLVLVDRTGRPFPALLEDLVLGPIGMTNSTFDQPLPASLAGLASAAHHGDGSMVPGRFHVYPEMAAAGLWTTPTDLLKWAIEIAAARAGRSSKVLSRAMATEMLTAQKGRAGLGPFVDGTGRAFRFSHVGGNDGFHAELVYYPETGQGAAVMVNSDGGSPMIREILYAIAAEYQWPEFAPRTIEVVPMDSSALDQVAGVYRMVTPVPATLTLVREGARLFIDAPILGVRSPMAFTSPTDAVMLDGDIPFKFVRGNDGAITRLTFGAFQADKR